MTCRQALFRANQDGLDKCKNYGVSNIGKRYDIEKLLSEARESPLSEKGDLGER